MTVSSRELELSSHLINHHREQLLGLISDGISAGTSGQQSTEGTLEHLTTAAKTYLRFAYSFIVYFK